MYGLDELAETSDDIEVAITLDSAKLTSNLFYVTAGMKIVDCCAKEPLTGKFVMEYGNLQSRDKSIVFQINLMKDIKEGYQYFKGLFDFFTAVQWNGLAADGYGKSIKTLIVSSPQNFKSYRASLVKGGAAKRDIKPCYCCNISSNELAHAKILSERCEKFIEINKEWCYYWNIEDSEYLEVSYYLINITNTIFLIENEQIFNKLCWKRKFY